MEYVEPLSNPGPGGSYVDGNPAAGVAGSTLPAAAAEHPQREIVATIVAAGLAPDGEDLSQLAAAIIALGGSATALLKGKHTLFIPADYIKPRTTNPCSEIATLETAANKVNVRIRAFDAAAAEYGQLGLFLPKSWDGGTIEYRVAWSHPATDTNFGVVWSLAGVSIGNAEALDAAFGDAVDLADTGGATETLYLTDWSEPVMIAGAGAAEEQILQIGRKVADAADTLAVDARLHRVEIRLTLDKGTDA